MFLGITVQLCADAQSPAIISNCVAANLRLTMLYQIQNLYVQTTSYIQKIQENLLLLLFIKFIFDGNKLYLITFVSYVPL